MASALPCCAFQQYTGSTAPQQQKAARMTGLGMNRGNHDYVHGRPRGLCAAGRVFANSQIIALPCHVDFPFAMS